MNDELSSDINGEKNNQKLSFFELNLIYKNKINTDYSELDNQKGELSPRLLFRKRRLDENKNNDTNMNKNAVKIKNVFDNYLDFVHESYFSNDKQDNEDLNDEKKSFKFTSLDMLINPLRQKFIFETWSPYEIALFNCCVCKFWKNFDLYTKVIKTKTQDEILSFYYYWKQSKFYKTLKNSKYKKNKCIK